MSAKPHDSSAQKRILEILRLIIENPGYYTKKHLAQISQVTTDTISRYFEDIKNAGFHLDYDENYRYFLKPEKTTNQIKELLLISDSEKKLIAESLEGKLDQPKLTRIVNKLETLANLPRIGNIIFTKPYLAKTAILLQAMRDKQKVIIYNYRSTNSNSKNNRTLEPFHISLEEDILHAYDSDKQKIRHYRMSRMERIEQLNEDWENEGKHNIIATDIFKISDKEQIPVHIRLKIGGYNELIERYPLSKSALSPAPDTEDEFDLICKVNHNFYGLQNFLLGYAQYVVEIIENDTLRAHMANKIKEIKY